MVKNKKAPSLVKDSGRDTKIGNRYSVSRPQGLNQSLGGRKMKKRYKFIVLDEKLWKEKKGYVKDEKLDIEALTNDLNSRIELMDCLVVDNHLVYWHDEVIGRQYHNYLKSIWDKGEVEITGNVWYSTVVPPEVNGLQGMVGKFVEGILVIAPVVNKKKEAK